ncbi:MAG: NAD(P)/FAD-dependent oxidoreductase, partial [Chitinophagales bacterium]
MNSENTAQNKTAEQFDAVVIGAGIGGLTAAAMLCKAGLKVCVLEMDVRPGGYLAGFKRKDFRFDSAIHWLNQCGPKGSVTRAFELLGNDFPKAKAQQRIKRYKGNAYDYLLTNKPDEWKKELIRDFPHEEKGLHKFFAAAKKIGKSFDNANDFFRSPESMTIFGKALTSLRKLKFALPFMRYIRYSGPGGLTKGLNTFFKDPKLHAVFCSEPDLLSCLVPIGWAYYNDYQFPPVGGSQVFPEWLSYVIQQTGGEIRFRSKVIGVDVKNGRCKGLTVQHRNREYYIASDIILAACDMDTLYNKMLPQDAVSGKMKAALEKAELYSSSVTLSIALDCPVEDLGFTEEMIFLCDETLSRDKYSNGDPKTSGISILPPSLRDPSLVPKGKGTLTIYVPAFFDHNEHWKTEQRADGSLMRGEAYKAFKKEFAEVLIKRVEDSLAPELSKHIEYFDVATPITHWRYTGNKNGTIMGARPGKENMMAGVAHYRTPVKGLYMSGHWAELGGGVPIAVKGGVNSAIIALKDAGHRAYKVYADYFDGKIKKDAAWSSPVLKQYDNS